MTWRQRAMALAPLVAVGGLTMVAPSNDGPTICPFALCTGTACPGCGMTRAAAALVRGDIDLAMTLHPLVILVVAQLAAGWVWWLLQRMGRVGAPSGRVVNVSLISTGVALAAVWVVRIAMGTLPPV